MKPISFKLDSQLQDPLYLQLYQRFIFAIQSQQLKPQDRIPSIRALASELNISRGTVELAYQILISEGLLEAKGAAGTFISEAAGHLPSMEKPNDLELNKKSISITSMIGQLDQTFQLGLPALDAFPLKLWNRLTNRALRAEMGQTLKYPDPQGDLALRQQLASYLGISRNVQCSPEQIFINTGYRASLWLITQTLLQKNDLGWYEDPGYFIARDFLKQMQMNLIKVPVDENGLRVDIGIQKSPQAKFAIVTPTHQSPTNVTLNLERRLALLDWANQNHSWIIEDDYDSEFHYQGRAQPTLKSLDNHHRVIYCGTFSKTLFPALRLSYIVVPITHVAEFKKMANILGDHAPLLSQKIVQQFILEGHFYRHLRKMRKLYKERRQYLLNAIDQELSEIMTVHPQMGGMHLIAEIKPKISAAELVTRAQNAGITLQSIDHWYEKKPLKEQILLSFTNIVSFEMAQKLCRQLRYCWLKK